MNWLLKKNQAYAPNYMKQGKDGIETARKLRERDEDTILIFITGIREYVFEAFDVAAFHYLLKPVEEDKFREVFRRAERELEKRKKQQRETVFVKTRNRSFTLDADSILYVESRGKKVEIHTQGETIEAYASMNEMEAQRGIHCRSMKGHIRGRLLRRQKRQTLHGRQESPSNPGHWTASRGNLWKQT